VISEEASQPSLSIPLVVPVAVGVAVGAVLVVIAIVVVVVCCCRRRKTNEKHPNITSEFISPSDVLFHQFL